jgi:hypothetical protein
LKRNLLTIQLNELYLKLDAATPFRRIVFDNIERASKKKRKKKNGLRNGKTEYIDTNKKTVKKEMYKDGKQKNNFLRATESIYHSNTRLLNNGFLTQALKMKKITLFLTINIQL